MKTLFGKSILPFKQFEWIRLLQLKADRCKISEANQRLIKRRSKGNLNHRLYSLEFRSYFLLFLVYS